MEVDKELIDKLLVEYKGPEDLIGEQGLLKRLTKALVECAMHAELTHHLGYEKHDASDRGSGNSRNGTSRKKLKGDFGEAVIEVVWVGPVKGIPITHAPHGEELQLDNLAAQLGHALEPIHLCFLAQFVALRHEHFSPAEPQLSLPLLHIAPHRSLPTGCSRSASERNVDRLHRNPKRAEDAGTTKAAL
jgi:putative transposase